jgi:hypothetical protein
MSKAYELAITFWWVHLSITICVEVLSSLFFIGEILLKSEIQIQIKVILEVFNYQHEGGKRKH